MGLDVYKLKVYRGDVNVTNYDDLQNHDVFTHKTSINKKNYELDLETTNNKNLNELFEYFGSYVHKMGLKLVDVDHYQKLYNSTIDDIHYYFLSDLHEFDDQTMYYMYKDAVKDNFGIISVFFFENKVVGHNAQELAVVEIKDNPTLIFDDVDYQRGGEKLSLSN